ncbi:ATPase [Campylobacter hyointestinalis subsp. hyointestinalis]|uniref:ATPase n=1 Tax=Campylobacter hyointestinalis subsp. hyointestinalis TaxID=91352 RepID=A0A0S4SU75_CAMHY|nr:ATP-binding protein [Campylobacter hyointestinalis]CUU90014.1 ATPase [Campylobacter hyointestinalis subsp. hyointestinalis]
MLINPFYYGGSVQAEHFCNRIDEMEELTSDIYAGINVLIYAPRRFGKTSFVLKTMSNLNANDVKYIFLDFMYISTIDEFINRYFDLLAKSLEEPIDKVVKFFKNILNIKPNINVSFDLAGNPSFSLSMSDDNRIKTLEDVLNIPLDFANKGKRIVIIFDEFQEVESLDLEAKIRSIVQHHSNKVSYVFMGSKKSLLSSMFLDKNRPFYKSVKHFTIKEIQKDAWKDFITAKFTSTNKTIDQIYIDKIFEITKGFPYYTQQFAYELWNKCDKQVDDEVFSATLKTIIEREEDLFALEWSNLTQNQKKALKIVLEKGGKMLYDEAMMTKYQLKLGSFQVALKGLIQKDIIDKNAKEYYLSDPLFEFWVRHDMLYTTNYVNT